MKMKRYGAILLAIFTVSVILAAVPAVAVKPGLDHNNVGKHAYKINIIGRPNTWSGDVNKLTGFGSKVIFISLHTAVEPVNCTGSSIVKPGGYSTVNVQGGQRIYFYDDPNLDFDVLDRNAIDGYALVSIPAGSYEIYVRVLGKPGGCLNAYAYKYIDGTLWYYIGELDAIRSSGTPEKVNVKQLFYDNTGTAYFDNVWDHYFWVMQNDGLRNMQLIFYEV